MFYLVKNQGIKKLKEKISELELYGDCFGNNYGVTFLVFTDHSIAEETDCLQLNLLELLRYSASKALSTRLKIAHWLNKLNASYQEPF